MPESAILAAVFYRLHPAQYRIFLPSDRVDATVYVPDFSRHRDGSSRPNSLVRHSPVRIDVRRSNLVDAQHPQGRAIRLGIRGRTKKRHRSRPRDVVRADGGAAAHRRLEPVAQRIAVHALSAVCRRQMARSLPRHAVHPAANHCLSHAVRREPARYSDSGLRRYGDRLSGVRHRADDDGRRQVFHQYRVRDVRHVPRWRRQGLRVCERTARHRRRQHRFQRADRGHHDHPGDEKDRLHSVLFRRDRSLRLHRRGIGAAGAWRHRLRHGAVHEHQLRRRRPGSNHPVGATPPATS